MASTGLDSTQPSASAGPNAMPIVAGGRGSKTEQYRKNEAAKEEVQRKLATGVYSIVLIDEGKSTQSPAWKKFGRVVDTHTQQKLQFVQCRNPECAVVKMLTSGRGNMKDHTCKRSSVRTSAPTHEAKDKFVTSLVAFCALNILPTTIVEGNEFLQVLRCAMDIARAHGPIDPRDFVPHPTTLARQVKAAADDARKILINEIKSDLEDGFGSATVDGWTDGQRGRKYLTHTVELIDKDFQLRDHVLFTPYCEAESVTADVINDEIKSNLASLDLDPNTTKLHYVTDDGADIVCAVRDSERTYCADHCTNLTVKKALTVQLIRTDLYGAEGGSILESVDKAVNIIKSSRKRHVAMTTLKQKLVSGPKNRRTQVHFKSCVPMLASVQRNFTQVKTTVAQMGHSFFDGISIDDIKNVIETVSPIEDIARQHKEKLFVGANHATIDSLTATKESDTPLQTSIKAHIRKELLTILRILQLFQKLKSIVTLLKRSGLNDTLIGGSLKQEVETRWLSNLRMLKSFFSPGDGEQRLSKLDQINNILRGRNCNDLLISEDDRDIMEHMIKILSSFDVAIKKFESSKEPTIQHVVPQFLQLQAAVKINAGDRDVISTFKARLQSQLDKKFAPNISLRHKIGTFLWPKFTSLALPGWTPQQRSEVLAAVRELCAKEAAVLKSREPQLPSSRKRRRTEAADQPDQDGSAESEDEYSTLCDSTIAAQQDEVDLYLCLADTSVKSKDILTWWKNKAAVFPALSRVARKILATPASSAASERLFSVAGRLISSRRSCLLPETVNDILFLHDFLKKGGHLPKAQNQSDAVI